MQVFNDVTVFLENFQTLGRTFDVLVINRKVNIQGLLDLGLTPLLRKEIILGLRTENYVSGPSPDADYANHYVLIFGTFSPLDSREIYIKLSNRTENSQALCLSFHPSQYPLNYPLRMTQGPLNRPLRN